MSENALEIPRDRKPAAADPGAVITGPGLGRVKLSVGAAAFILITAGIFWYQFNLIGDGEAAPRWDQLRWKYFGLILLCLPVETLAAAIRTWTVYRTLQPSVRLWTCVKGEWVNVTLNTLTPSHLGGGLGQVYIFSREGVTVGRAFTASLLSFLGTIVGLLCLGFYSLIFSATATTRPLFDATLWTLVITSAAMVLAAAWPRGLGLVLGGISRTLWRLGPRRRPLEDWWPPDQARTDAPVDRMGRLAGKLVGLVYAYRADVGRFLRVGKLAVIWVCLLGLAFLLARAFLAFLCIRFLGIEASSLGQILTIQIALVFLIFFAPTPGGAGLAEGVSLALMAEIVPVGFAPYYNFLWRFLTVYLAALAGAFCLARAMVQDAQARIRCRR